MSKVKNLKQNQESKEQIGKNKIKQRQREDKQKQSKNKQNLSIILYLVISNIYLLLLFLQKAYFYLKSISKFRPPLESMLSLLFSSLYNDKKVKTIKKENNKNGNINLLRIYKRIIKIIIVINLFIVTFPNNKLNLMELHSSKITLKIEGNGTKNVFSSHVYYNATYNPDEVHINGNKENIVKSTYYLNQSNNIVELIWNKNKIIVVICFVIVMILLKLIYLILIVHKLLI